MIVERAIWTTLPYGLSEDQRLRLSVHVGPRLTTDDGDPSPRKLGEFPAFESWAPRVADMKWHVEFGNGVSARAMAQDQPDVDLWSRLFPPETFVRPHTFRDHAKRNLHVFPVREVLGFIRNTYASLSAAGPDLPSIDGSNPLTVAFGPLAGLTDEIQRSKSFWQEWGRAQEGLKDKPDRPDGVVVSETVSSSSGAANALFQAYRFYHRPGDHRSQIDFDPKYREPPADPPKLDFHDLVSLLADHPLLLRMLGLVVDLVVDLRDPHGQLPVGGTVRVIPDGDLPETPPRTPWTRYDLKDQWFGARPADGFLMERGLVRLSREFWDLFQVDVDGAALQSVGFGDTLDRLLDPERRNHETPGETGAPALRSGGFSLARNDRGKKLLAGLKARRDLNTQIEQGATVTFAAEDLVRGYRVDIFDENAPGGARWFTLHDRRTRHAVGHPSAGEPRRLEPIRDEGFVKATAASSERQDHDKPSDDLYLHETVVSWDGWSLAAPRPGKRIVEPGEGENGGKSPLARHDPQAGQLWPLVSTVEAAPKSLPRLRTGHKYRVRIRTVDLAGNSVAFTPDELAPPDSDLASESQRAVRFEPVPSPTVLRRHLDTEGESLEHLVIRSNGGISAKDYAASAAINEALAEAGVPHVYAEDSQRHLAPPKGSMQMAELDGKFDLAFGGTAQQMTAALRVALREEGTFLDPKIVDTATGLKTIDQSTITPHPPGAKLPTPTQRGSGLSADEPDFDKKRSGAYVFYPDERVRLPYLPDPMAVGIALVGYDHAGNEVLSHIEAFPGTWAELEPFRIRLSELPAPPTASTIQFIGGVLEVALPKAAVIRAKLSSVLPDGRLKDLAIWDWTAPALGPVQTVGLEKAAMAGRHWMLTPQRWLTFTHAVQQPLLVPVSLLSPSRKLGETFATFGGEIKNHAESTGRLDVFADWTEDVDLITDKEPKMARTKNAVPHSAQAFGFDIAPAENVAKVALNAPTIQRVSRHEFGDTKHRRIVYHSVATTRFREFFPPKIANDPDAIQVREQWQDAAGNWLQPLIIDVPSSARPAAPDVVQTLPTFRWEHDESGPVRRHVRHGKAIRVWMRRPWFSSGDGEQLAVVLEPATRLAPGWVGPFDMIEKAAVGFVAQSHKKRAPAKKVARKKAGAPTPGSTGASNATAAFMIKPGIFQAQVLAQIREMLRPYVTRWGSDPVWASRLPVLPPTIGDFPARISDATGLTLEEVAPSATVNIAGHEVYFDSDRGLWYSDIEIDNGDSYYPFVRLALARYQPHSLPNAHLSRVAMTDFMQVAPTRTAEIQVGQNAAGVTVRGYGGANILAKLWSPIFADILADSDTPAPNTKVRAVLQRRPKEIPGDLGWEPIGPEITLAPNASGFQVTWVGTLPVPTSTDDLDRRILITEIETFPRDMLPSDPPYMTSFRDHVRERIVYADTFEL